MGRKVERMVAILNGVVGDHLARTGNGLATELSFVREGVPVSPEDALAPGASRIAVLVHGLMNDETVWEFEDGTADYGSRLSADLAYAPLYVRYNSGLQITDSGAALSRLLELLVRAQPHPPKEVLLIGYSMGGLVIRSACHVATVEKHTWLSLVRRAVYVGTPHRGAPMEQVGKLVTRVLHAIDDPYVRLAAQLGDLRSTGIKDLGDPQHPVPLLPTIRHYLVAGAISSDPLLAALFGDWVVPVASATDGACVTAETMALPPSHVRLFERLGHLELPRTEAVYDAVRTFCSEEAPS